MTRIGTVKIPADLETFPLLRNGSKEQGWFLVENGNFNGLKPTEDRSLPLGSLVNDTLLKEMLVTDWRPEDKW